MVKRMHFRPRWYKRLAIFLLGGALGLGLFGCVKQEQQAQPIEQDRRAIELTFAVVEPHLEADREVWQDIVRSYMDRQADVGIDLEFIDSEPSVWRTRVTTMLQTATAPDIFQTQSTWSQADYRKHLLADLTTYYEKPNPYDHNRIWKHNFVQRITDELIDPTTGAISAVSLYWNDVSLYYNQSLFESLQIEIPQTWMQFMNIQAHIKQIGIVPFAFANAGPPESNFADAVNVLMNDLAASKVKALDWNGDQRIQLHEVVGALDQGQIQIKEKDWHGFMPHLKAWSQYWPEHYNVLRIDDAMEMFLNGEAAMVMVDDARAGKLKRSSSLDFEYDSFAFPVLTEKEGQEQGAGDQVVLSQLDGVFSIPLEVQGERLDAAIDFLMYLTSPEVTETVEEKLNRTSTLNEGKRSHAAQRNHGPPFLNLFSPLIDIPSYESLIQVGQLYMDDTITLENYVEEIHRTLQLGAERLMNENNWSKANRYGIEP